MAHDSQVAKVTVPQQLYCRISQLKCRPIVEDKESSSLSCGAKSVSLQKPLSEALELQQLLHSSIMEACLQAHDIVISEVYDLEDKESSHESVPVPLKSGRDSFLNGEMYPVESKETGTSKDDLFPTSFGAGDESDDPLMDSIARIRLVQFQKDGDEPMGITLKVRERSSS
ncbi:L27 domain protein [Ostertagia ostertagi]